MGLTGLQTSHLGCTLSFAAPLAQIQSISKRNLRWFLYLSKLATATNYRLLLFHNKGAKHQATLECERRKPRGKKAVYRDAAPPVLVTHPQH